MTCISLGLSAQHQKKNFRELSASERAEKMSDRMAEELKLTEEQKKQVSKVALENATRQEELMQKQHLQECQLDLHCIIQLEQVEQED